jgi:hypothetical protein
VERWMRETRDPRTDPAHDAWDAYPYFGPPARPEGGARKAAPARR